jgi:hypothetical protein
LEEANSQTKVVGEIKTHILFSISFFSPENRALYDSVYQPPGRGPVPGPDVNYTEPGEVLLQVVILVF